MEKRYTGDFHIDFNDTECQAMEAFLRGESEEGSRIQAQFLAKAKEAMARAESSAARRTEEILAEKRGACDALRSAARERLPAAVELIVGRVVSI